MSVLPSPSDLAKEFAELATPESADAPTCGTANAWSSLSATEQTAWEGFLEAHAALQAELERELNEAHRLSFNDYFALLALERAPERRLRMHDLARPVRLTRSGLTRLVERLERDGLIERLPCPSDARGTDARITDKGSELLHIASETHLAGVRARFLERFSKAELKTLAEQFARLAS